MVRAQSQSAHGYELDNGTSSVSERFEEKRWVIETGGSHRGPSWPRSPLVLRFLCVGRRAGAGPWHAYDQSDEQFRLDHLECHW